METVYFAKIPKLCKLYSLVESERNLVINEKEIDALLHHEYVIANNVHFIPYNSCVKDVGWGCAWRAIQTYLSCNGITVSFEKLVNEFARKDDLLKAIKQTNVIDAKVVYVLERNTYKWAPETIDNFWAYPFIGKIVADSYGVSSRLVLLNGYPTSANAPQCVFQDIINFNSFGEILYRCLQRHSVMIDDGKFAMSIIGYRRQGSNIKLVFADPHILNNRNDHGVGLYAATYTPLGEMVNLYITEYRKDLLLYNTTASLHFKEKSWMVLYSE